MWAEVQGRCKVETLISITEKLFKIKYLTKQDEEIKEEFLRYIQSKSSITCSTILILALTTITFSSKGGKFPPLFTSLVQNQSFHATQYDLGRSVG